MNALRDLTPSQRERVLPTLAAAAVALLLLGPLAYVGHQRSADAARNQTRAEANDRFRHAFAAARTDQIEWPVNVWQVNPEEGWFDSLGEVTTDPPVVSLAQMAFTSEPETEYDFDGPWFAAAEAVTDTDVIVTVVDRSAQDAAIAASSRNWTLVTLLFSLLAGLLAWFGLGRIKAPVRRAHAVNRDFIADAAHELRTPLSIIQASAGHALARDRSPDAYRESLSEILAATERAGSSVGELLEFARLEAGQATLRFAPLRLDLLVEEVATSIRVDGVTVEAIPGEAVVVEADYNLLRQVVDNITRNAAARANKVTLTTHLETRHARVQIADDGPGFDPGVIEHVFERFRRGDRSGSVGLGMAIARTVVEMHGGTCEATNHGADEASGALVTVTLPFKQ